MINLKRAAVLEGMKKANDEFDLICRYLPSIDRSRSFEHVTSVLKMALTLDRNLTIGIDVSGNPKCNDQNEAIINEIQKAKDAGFKIAAHAGETKDSVNQAAGDLLRLTDRIGHGTHLVNDSRSL